MWEFIPALLLSQRKAVSHLRNSNIEISGANSSRTQTHTHIYIYYININIIYIYIYAHTHSAAISCKVRCALTLALRPRNRLTNCNLKLLRSIAKFQRVELEPTVFSLRMCFSYCTTFGSCFVTGPLHSDSCVRTTEKRFQNYHHWFELFWVDLSYFKVLGWNYAPAHDVQLIWLVLSWFELLWATLRWLLVIKNDNSSKWLNMILGP